MEAKFNKRVFSTKKKFKNWLQKMTMHRIDLVDLGQDMQTMWVHKSGEILHTDFQSSIYTGKFINMDNLAVRDPLEISNDELEVYMKYNGLVVSKII